MRDFLGRYGGFPKNTTIQSKLARATMDKSLKNIRLYDFRHYFATRFYMFSRDPFKLKEYMGHKKFETTEIYTKLVDFRRNPSMSPAQQALRKGY